MAQKLSSRGDTIIEVVLAMALLTSILFIAWSITNRAGQIMLAARERTVMVNHVKEQAELVKSKWVENPQFASGSNYQNVTVSSGDPCEGYSAGGWTPQGGSAWHLKVDVATKAVVKDDSLKRDPNNPESYIWIQKKTVGDPGNGYTDFYVRACWLNNSGSVQKNENTQVVVRLNT